MALAMVLIFSGAALAQERGSITIHVDKLRNDSGVVRIALFNSEAGYARSKFSADQAFAKAAVGIQNGQADYTFANIPYGQYAIKLFHDEDNSGKFYTNLLGIPKVEFGFSNNAHGRFGPAGYDRSKFVLGQSELKMTIDMQRI